MSIESLAAQIPQGHSQNSLICPQCGGGSSKDKSLSITKDDTGVKWICFRAKCGYRGYMKGNVNNEVIDKPIVKAPTEFREATRNLTNAEEDELYSKYGVFRSYTNNWRMWDGYVVMPVLDAYGKQVGTSLKDLRARSERPKTRYYGVPGAMHWETRDPYYSSTVYVVEDMLSATRVGQYVPAVALMGTHFNSDRAVELSKKYKRAVFLLDEDAWGKAMKYCQEYSILFEEGLCYQTWDSGVDVKDMTFAEFETVLWG